MMRKLFAVFVCAILMALVFSGCGGDSGSSGPSNYDYTTAAVSAPDAAVELRNKIYLGLSNGGIDISTDGGKTFTKDGLVDGPVQKIFVDYNGIPRCIENLTGSVYRRVVASGGKVEWRKEAAHTGQVFNDIWGAGWVWVAVGRNGFGIATADGGDSWNELIVRLTTHQDLYAIHFDGVTYHFFGENVHVTTADFLNWTLQPALTFATVTCLAMTSPDSGWAFTNNGEVYRTKQGWHIWDRQYIDPGTVSPSVLHFRAAAARGNRVIAVGDIYKQGTADRANIWISNDSGEGWATPSGINSLTPQNYTGVAFVSTNEALVTGYNKTLLRIRGNIIEEVKLQKGSDVDLGMNP